MFNKELLRKIYLANISAIAVVLPLSVWLLTFFIITLTVLWIADGGLAKISAVGKSRKSIFIFSGTYIVFILWMINTTNIGYGLRELEQKLPLLLLPLIIGLSDPSDEHDLKTILSFFVAGVVISSLTGWVYFLTGTLHKTSDIRNISMFIPYMQLAEMTNMAIAISVYYFFEGSSQKTRYIFLAAAAWLICFLFILLSVTGILLFGVLLLIAVYLLTRRSENILLKIGSVSLLFLLLLSAGIYVSHEITDFYKSKCTFYTYPLKERTINGNAYRHYPERKDIENGNPVWIYICEQEMRKEWNRRSSISYDSLDLREQQLRVTLIRYLASKCLTKDSTGMAQLTASDLKYIENGITNVIFTKRNHLKSKIYEIIWQIDYYSNGGNPSGNSVTQRIEFLKTGLNCFRRNVLFGTGTGDFKDAVLSQYTADNSRLNNAYRYLPHNQYLTFLISFGISGFIILCFAVIYPIVKMKIRKNILFNIFLVIILLSMFGEDTLETHTGLTFFAYFYGLFVFGKKEEII